LRVRSFLVGLGYIISVAMCICFGEFWWVTIKFNKSVILIFPLLSLLKRTRGHDYTHYSSYFRPEPFFLPPVMCVQFVCKFNMCIASSLSLVWEVPSSGVFAGTPSTCKPFLHYWPSHSCHLSWTRVLSPLEVMARLAASWINKYTIHWFNLRRWRGGKLERRWKTHIFPQVDVQVSILKSIHHQIIENITASPSSMIPYLTQKWES
jgi:hypothetical protein